MAATVIEIADAVVAKLNTASLSQPVTAVRFYQPLFELPEMDKLHVSVVPRGIVLTQASRVSVSRDIQIDVAVQKRFSQGDAAELDPLLLLVEEILNLFLLKVMGQTVCVKAENNPVYAPEHMSELRQFTSVVTLTFRKVS